MAVPCLGDYWLGCSKGFYYDDMWSWTDAQGFIFDNWATGQPSRTAPNPSCLSVDSTTGKWTSASCDAKKVYVSGFQR
ncbi:hypothetical protein AAVH_30393 [Aphelenchoides avenae]|nr:hypothetical protein AAVH_30393 [Aphelenchus avenae]